MSQDLPIPRQSNRSDGPAVLEWGTPDPAPERLTRTVAGLGRDPRLPVVLVGLGGAAALASLMGEWLVMTLPENGPEGSGRLRVPSGVSEVGGFGVTYLVGLLGLAGAAALALGGTRDARRNARVLGSGLAVALLALLVAAAVSLDDSTRRSLFYSADSGFQVEYGRGLVMAFVAVALLGSALRLSGSADRGPGQEAGDGSRSPEHGSAARDEAADSPEHGSAAQDGAARSPEQATPEPGPTAERSDRPWWPRRRRRAVEEHPPVPEGLTVEPSAPFAGPEPPTGR
ncbi:hypothetical protein [Micromonospora sagamiensis]|uniref:Uncharacterized protein n=1 Tax=Micromonospora sagamiensis TaxID=47875 RepID=A0A562WPK1_9ACTN|nr:hypothetical protein [Micromonospora sagamiensis]TWJ32145.1 hypothetical protein JD81_05717 [Micromonospora sagamiensis]BCL14796.1 hypothetical protein GCM10017556_25350 [Micromonospora sagamiensis]